MGQFSENAPSAFLPAVAGVELGSFVVFFYSNHLLQHVSMVFFWRRKWSTHQDVNSKVKLCGFRAVLRMFCRGIGRDFNLLYGLDKACSSSENSGLDFSVWFYH